MSLKKSHGNMYDWVTHMHSHLGGVCPHECEYCYVQKNPFGVSPRYSGEVRLINNELRVNYGSAKTIFIEHMNDMFANGVKDEWIIDIFNHCNQHKSNSYVFQTKNPRRAHEFIGEFPQNFLIGTTIETNRKIDISKAPPPVERYLGVMLFKDEADIFITIEPIMDLDVEVLLLWLNEISPLFIAIGADSKKSDLDEPTPAKVKELIRKIQEKNISIKRKTNLGRLL